MLIKPSSSFLLDILKVCMWLLTGYQFGICCLIITCFKQNVLNIESMLTVLTFDHSRSSSLLSHNKYEVYQEILSQEALTSHIIICVCYGVSSPGCLLTWSKGSNESCLCWQILIQRFPRECITWILINGEVSHIPQTDHHMGWIDMPFQQMWQSCIRINSDWKWIGYWFRIKTIKAMHWVMEDAVGEKMMDR